MFKEPKAALAAVSLVTGSFTCTAALFIPPEGEIDQSVLIVIGQFLVFSATLLGVSDLKDKMVNLTKKDSKTEAQ